MLGSCTAKRRLRLVGVVIAVSCVTLGIVRAIQSLKIDGDSAFVNIFSCSFGAPVPMESGSCLDFDRATDGRWEFRNTSLRRPTVLSFPGFLWGGSSNPNSRLVPEWVPTSCNLYSNDNSLCGLRRCMKNKHIVVLGDSQSRYYTQALLSYFADPVCRMLKRGGSESACGESWSYFGLTNGTDRQNGDSLCSVVEARVWDRGMVQIENIGMSKVVDSRLAGITAGGAHLKTSQEVAAWHLGNDFKGPPGSRKPDVILVNTGLHDLATMPVNIYEKHLARYLALLVGTGSQVVWLQTTAVARAKQPRIWWNLTTDVRGQAYNRAARRVVRALADKGNRISIIETFNISSAPGRILHSDGVHMHSFNDVFYTTIIRRVLLGVLQSRGCKFL